MSGRRKNSGGATRGVRMIGHWVPGTFSGLDKLATGLRRSRLGRKVVELLAKVGRCGQRAAAGARSVFLIIHYATNRYKARSLNWVACTLLVAVVTQVGGAVVPDTRGNDGVLDLERPRIVVLKSKRVLHLFDGDRLVKTYPVALGRHPVGQKQCEGDGRTPEGRFHLVTKNRQSKYHRFLGLDYPDSAAVERGRRQGLITDGEARSITDALAAGRCPSWTTALGGAIGIHGHGASTDWTAGCVALEDDQAEQLFDLLRVGDEVEILP